MPISYFECKIFQMIWLKAFFSRKYFSSDLIQSSRCTTDCWLILIFQVKNGFLFWQGFMASDWPIRSHQLFMDQYLIKFESLLSHMDLSLTDFMIINSWHKRVVTFLTRDSLLHLAMNICNVLNLDGMVFWRLLTIRLWKPWLVFVDVLDLSSKFGCTDCNSYKMLVAESVTNIDVSYIM